MCFTLIGQMIPIALYINNDKQIAKMDRSQKRFVKQNTFIKTILVIKWIISLCIKMIIKMIQVIIL